MLHGDCLAVMPTLDAESVDAIVCDPPYALTSGKKGGSGVASLNVASPAGRSRIGTGGGFMGKQWDSSLPTVEMWVEALRVARPGAHLVAFGGTRTFHRLTCAIEDAGWEIRDCLSWLYGSGFPKSHDVSKALDKDAGHWRGRAGAVTIEQQAAKGREYERSHKGDPVTAAAAAAAGWGTALKPAWEPIILARKPLIGTVAANWTEHGTGALNIDACRIACEPFTFARGATALGRMNDDGWKPIEQSGENHPNGRWPANVVLDEVAAELLDEQTGPLTSNSGEPFNRNSDKFRATFSAFAGRREEDGFYGDTGGASRFFYTSKASTAERNEGVRGIALKQRDERRDPDLPGGNNPRNRGAKAVANSHPTVKPLDLMRWLCKLVTPPGGLILDPFTGSGSTGCAAVREGFRFIGIEREAEYVAIAEARIAHHTALFQPSLDLGGAA